MSERIINRTQNDALFKLVFGDYPENALSLYNAINKSDYTNVEDLQITTLRDAVYIGIKNDVSFLFNHDMNLYEHQSTFNPNMPLRGLGYFADLYQIHLGGAELARERIYSKNIVKIPAPKYYVFYNGVYEQPENMDLRLSDAYDGEGDVEITAHMVNVNKGNNKELMMHCKPLSDLAEFISRTRELMAQDHTKEESVEIAIESCIKDGILEEILRKERAKVANALYTALTEEEIERLRVYEMETAINEGLEKGLKEGREKGIKEGREKGIKEGREKGIKEGREKGIKEGREEGIKEGLEQGLEQGIEQGSRRTKFEDVDKLISSGLADAEKACEVLGVNIEEYKKHALI